ncbi:reverse transcriptase zinc-binding domain-containing protein [Tanacetum coccineum]
MGKKRGWFGFLKRFFACKAESIDAKGTKRRKWCLRILKISHHYHALETREVKVKDRKEDQKQHTMALAVAMTAAAEALSVAAANAAAELARLVAMSEDMGMRIRTAAAVKIQSFYRAHLIEFFKKKQLDISELNKESGEKQNLFENETSVFQIKIDELKKSLAKQIKENYDLLIKIDNLENVFADEEKRATLGKLNAFDNEKCDFESKVIHLEKIIAQKSIDFDDVKQNSQI